MSKNLIKKNKIFQFVNIDVFEKLIFFFINFFCLPFLKKKKIISIEIIANNLSVHVLLKVLKISI
jgi:hypothetical protein